MVHKQHSAQKRAANVTADIVIARNQTQSAVIKYLKTVDLEEIEKYIANDYFIEYKNLGMTEYETVRK